MGKCYLCPSQGVYGIVLAPTEVYSCESHYDELFYSFIKRKSRSVCDLHTSVDSYENTKTHKRQRISKGKDWEIKHRTLAEDGKTVINKVTGKEAQY